MVSAAFRAASKGRDAESPGKVARRFRLKFHGETLKSDGAVPYLYALKDDL
jgi:hypothetical protein